MKILKFTLALLISTGLYCQVYSQQSQGKTISIPVAGNCWLVNGIEGTEDVITADGISNWSKKEDVIKGYFYLSRTGKIDLALRAKPGKGNCVISISVNGENKKLILDGNNFQTISVGSYTIVSAGYQSVELRGIEREGSIFADITHFLISGPAADEKVFFVKDDFYFGRRGPSVHLKFELPSETGDIVWFYNELTVPEGNDVQGSYFMANGFGEGYFGIQVNSATERRILFSVWSPWKTDNPGEIPDDYKIKLLRKGTGVITGEFGNEGSGGQSYRKYYWKAGNTYRFLLKGEPSVNGSTDFTAWFFAPEINSWELIASFRRPKTTTYLKNLHSFLENFIPETGYFERKGHWGNQWVCNSTGKWFELTKARFTADATARKEARLDYSGGTEDGAFFLRNCGFFNGKTEINSIFTRPEKVTHPEIDFSLLK
jgi:hypothetical protein